MELTTRSTIHPLCGQRHLNMRMHQDSMCSSPEGVVALQRLARLYALAFLCAVGAPIIGCPTPLSLPLFHCFTSVTGACQPRPQGLLGGQNGGSEKTLANSRSRVSKTIGDFNLFNMAEESVTYSLVKTGNTSNWTLWSVDFIKIFILILLLSLYSFSQLKSIELR